VRPGRAADHSPPSSAAVMEEARYRPSGPHRACNGKTLPFFYHHLYLLIPRSRVLLEKLTGFQLVKKFPAFCGSRSFITAFTNVRHLPLSWAKCQSRAEAFCVNISSQNICFYGEELLAPRPTPKQEDHPLSAIRDCLFNIFAATLCTGGHSSIRNLRTRHTVVTGTDLSRIAIFKSINWTKVTYFSRAETSTHCFTSLNFVKSVKFIMVLLKTCQYIRNHTFIRTLVKHLISLLVSHCNLILPLILISVMFCLRYI